ncbi:MAG: M10 family metallopeptidase [Nitratireductor sp.]
MSNWTSNAYVNALLKGWGWDTASLDYYLAAGQWDATESAAIRAAFDTWEAVCNITFTQIFTSTGAEFSESQYSQSGTSTAGSHQSYVNYGSSTIARYGGQLTGQYNDAHFGWTTAGLQQGGFGFSTLIHEIGHGLGLDHTHFTGTGDPHVFPGVSSSSDTGDNALNQDIYSVMSYASTVTNPYGTVNNVDYTGLGQVATPMAFDIAAVQYLYGANLSTNTGNDIYHISDSNVAGTFFSCIWDAGGTDEIRYTGSRTVTIDLNPATLQNEAGGGGNLSHVTGNYNSNGVNLPVYGGFTIAGDFTNALADVNGTTGVIIENATGGSGNDTIIGNGANNRLIGNGGADNISGGAGDDWIDGGSGADILMGGLGNDTIIYDINDNWGGGAVNGGEGFDTLWFDNLILAIDLASYGFEQRTIHLTDQASNDWSDYYETRNLADAITEVTYLFDTGTSQTTVYDVDDNYWWSQWFRSYDTGGNLVSETYTPDPGSANYGNLLHYRGNAEHIWYGDSPTGTPVESWQNGNLVQPYQYWVQDASAIFFNGGTVTTDGWVEVNYILVGNGNWDVPLTLNGGLFDHLYGETSGDGIHFEVRSGSSLTLNASVQAYKAYFNGLGETSITGTFDIVQYIGVELGTVTVTSRSTSRPVIMEIFDGGVWKAEASGNGYYSADGGYASLYLHAGGQMIGNITWAGTSLVSGTITGSFTLGNFSQTGDSFLRIGDILPSSPSIGRIGTATINGDMGFYGNGTAVFNFDGTSNDSLAISGQLNLGSATIALEQASGSSYQFAAGENRHLATIGSIFSYADAATVNGQHADFGFALGEFATDTGYWSFRALNSGATGGTAIFDMSAGSQGAVVFLNQVDQVASVYQGVFASGTGGATYFADRILGTNHADYFIDSTPVFDDTFVNPPPVFGIEIFGQGGEDEIAGSRANDWLDGGADNDIINGYAGDDTIEGGAGADNLDGGANTSVGDTLSYAGSSAGVTVYLATNTVSGGDADGDTVTGFENVTGSSHVDYLFGDANANTINGNGGADWLYGGGGDDTMNGGAGADLMFGEAGNDTMNGGADGDYMWGGSESDTMHGNDGVDWLRGEEGVDYLYGDAGDDVLIGGSGDDQMYGGIDTDTFYGEDDNDWIYGEANGDVAFGQLGNDHIYGGSEGDFLFGGAGADLINGGTQNDLMWGDMPGTFDSAADTFEFDANWGFDAVYDFELGVDQVRFTSIAGLTQFSSFTLYDGGANVTIAFGADAITFYGVTQAELLANQGDFSFV